MPIIPDIPEMVNPSLGSSVAFVAVIAFVSIAIVAGVWRGGPTGEPIATKHRWGIGAAICMSIWLAIGAVVPLSGILETKMLPPPPIFLVGTSFLLAVIIAFSSTGLRLARLPLAALIGLHAVWLFNLVGTSLLTVVIFIALTSSPFPFRQYMNEPQVLLVYHFPFSWIVSVAVAGALLGHLVLFRKLLTRAEC